MNTLNTEFLGAITDPLLEEDAYPPFQHSLKLYDQQLSDAADHEQLQRQLKMNGMTYAHDDQRQPVRRYRFFIAQQDCFHIEQSVRKDVTNDQVLMIAGTRVGKQWKMHSIPDISSRSEVRKGRQLAIRALYVLGYDLGIVEVGYYQRKPRLALLQFYPFPSVPGRARWKQRLQRSMEKTLNRHDAKMTLKLGADVEFVLRHKNGKYVPASKYLKRSGKVGHDAIRLRGYHGQFPLAELRPEPDASPVRLYENMVHCMYSAMNIIRNPDIEWLAGGKPLGGYPIGGHIHFSGIPLTSKLVRALDNYLTLPLFLAESDESISRRPMYGALGDVRKQTHGGFEYRTPPSWLIHPTLARGVLCLSKVIALDHMRLTRMPLNRADVQEAFYTGQKETVRPLVRQLWLDLQECPTFAEYEASLQAFYDYVMTDTPWDEYRDIRAAWGLSPSS